MGHKIFISYKYADDNVKKITNNSYTRDTVRDYVDVLENYFTEHSNNIYKGESDDEDLSYLSDDAIWNKLKDRIYDSTLTIVMISPNMKENTLDRNQWIPWEISYSLKEESRKNSSGNMVTSKSNGIIALVLPDFYGSYNYYIDDHNCCNGGCRILKTDRLFQILRDNMFNIKNPNDENCEAGRHIYHGDSSYIISVKWKDFCEDPNKYIEKALKLQNSIEQYNIVKEV